ncbi:MAG TPA: crosslink repair DNA glycosylase YcaQ family protein, partial [Acidimicrobiia bacterium]|nr:crosslink repair DNA glycosylase YcaQ family protein [Acidimicrobiia bacterium]
QLLTAERRVRDTDGIHDLLRRLGPLSFADIDVRSEDVEVGTALQHLADTHRIIEVRIGGHQRWAAIEDAGRLRDAMGVQPPPGTPHVFLEPVPDPLGDVVGRYARTHGPFTAASAASSLALPPGVVEAALTQLQQQGRVARGNFHHGAGPEWIDLEVLKRLKRRSLSTLRKEIEPVEPTALGRFLPPWQRVAFQPPRGRGPLGEAIRRLQGYELAASVLERDVLPARVADHGPQLDQLMLEGEVVWAGRGPLGSRDGKVALYLRSQLSLLWQPPAVAPPDSPTHEAIRTHLSQRGASFFADIYQAVGGGDPEVVLDSLWDLVWAGEITNDTLAPLRAFTSWRGRRPTGRPQTSSRFPPHASGRWSVLSCSATDPTSSVAAWAELLLDRYGVVTRGHVLAEGVPGGFTALYPVFSRLEEIGRLRRGYFIEGMGGAQFALPGAVDRLRAPSAGDLIGLAATDPANPYGAALPWPANADARLARSAGSYVIVGDGRLVAYLERGGRRLLMLEPERDLHGPLARELATIAQRQRRFTLERIDQTPAAQSGLAPALTEWGFVPGVRGLTFRH